MKKKFFILILVLIITVSSFCSISVFALDEDETDIITDTPVVFEQGDVNLDGILEISDATTIQMYCAFLTTFNSTQKSLADLDKNGVIDVSDATYIQKILAGLIEADSDDKDAPIELPIIPVGK